ncbi:MAG: imidazoleglycerol-phosphate dehydratase, partial [Clostridia bacterium]
IEGIFKAFGRVLRKAVYIDVDFLGVIPSTKGTL